MKTQYPNPNETFPIKGVQRTVFLKNVVKHPQIIIGDYTYYDDPDDVHHFEKNVINFYLKLVLIFWQI